MGTGRGYSTPAEKLALLMNKDLGTSVSPRTLELFILARWARVSALAHDIHDSAKAEEDKSDG